MGRGDLQFLVKKVKASQVPRRVYVVWRVLSRMCFPRCWKEFCSQVDSQTAQELVGRSNLAVSSGLLSLFVLNERKT
jgi:hypothetical protein